MKLHLKFVAVICIMTILLSACAKPPVPATSALLTVSPAAVSTPVVTSAPTFTPAPTPSPSPSPVPTPFTIIWLSDTQRMAFEFPRPLEAMGKWIADNKDVENIIYVIQTGDIVENGFAPRHWENFDLCYNQFRDILPYFPIAGNHDVAINRNDYAAYLERPFFAAYPPENLFEGGKALYTELHAGGLDFLLLGAGWNAELDATEWMNQVLAAHPDHTAILLFHGYINADGGFTVIGKKMYEQVVLPNPNVKLVLCGHCSGTTGERVHEIDDDGNGEIDRKVYALMYNFQNQYEPNSGQLCKVLVDPIARTFRFTVYSPYSGRFHRDHFHRSESFLLQELF